MTNRHPIRGEVWIAKLDPTRGSEQAGIRPVIVFQNDTVSRFSTTAVVIPLTTNIRRAELPICVFITQGNGGLSRDSVALCFQLRAIDRSRLIKYVGKLNATTISEIEETVLVTLGYGTT